MTRVFFVSFPFSFFFLLFFPLSFFLSSFPRSGSPDVKQRRYGLKFWFGLDWTGLPPSCAWIFCSSPVPLSPPPLVPPPSCLPCPPPLPCLYFTWGCWAGGGGLSRCCLLPASLTHSIHPHPTLVSDIKRCLNSCRCLQSPFCVFPVVYLAFFFLMVVFYFLPLILIILSFL